MTTDSIRIRSLVIILLISFFFSKETFAEYKKKRTANAQPVKVVKDNKKLNQVAQADSEHNELTNPMKGRPMMGSQSGPQTINTKPGTASQTGGGKVSDLGKEAQLKKLIDPHHGLKDMSGGGKGFTARRGGGLPGQSSVTPSASRATVQRGYGKNQGSRRENQGASGVSNPSWGGNQNQGSRSGGSSGSGSSSATGASGTPWSGDRSAYDKPAGSGRSEGSSSGGGSQAEARDPEHGMTAAEARAEEDRQKKSMSDSEFKAYEESLRRDAQAGMTDAELNAYAAQNKYEDTGQDKMSDKEYKDYQERVKKEQKEIDGGMPIPDAIATDAVSINLEETEKKRKRQVGMTNEWKRQQEKPNIQITNKDIVDKRTSRLINPVEGRDGNTVGISTSGTVLSPKSPNNPTGRPILGNNQPPSGDPSDAVE